MKVKLLEQAREDLRDMDNSVYAIFKKQLRNIMENPYQRHLRHGMPYYVKEVGQGRIIYTIEEDTDTVYVVRCFQNHKDYESWYKGLR